MPAVAQHVALPDRYRLVRHIANGGMASVWAAEDALLERLVAVKVLAPGYAADPVARRRFTREARAAARVSDHPHVVTVFDIGESTDEVPQAFIVMEHLAGGTVADRLRRDEPVPIPTALRWLSEAASALDAAHEADIVHRDVKPGNLLLDDRGRLAVGDFGIASIAGDTQVTVAGQVLGTAAYLSPEQARGHAATPASDRYSLAVVAYELLCGRRPFAGETPLAQARAHVEVEPPTPDGPCQAAADVLKHGLSKDPAQRPPTAAAFVASLEAVLGADAAPTRVLSGLTQRQGEPDGPDRARFDRDAPAPAIAESRDRVPPPMPVARPRSPHRGAWMLAGLAAVCLGGGAAAALIGDEGNAGDDGRPQVRSSSRQAATPTERSNATNKTSTTDSSARSATPSATSESPTTSSGSSSTTSGSPTTATSTPTSDNRSPAQLNNAGYAKLPGDPQGALPLIQRALEQFRATNNKGLDYAFALYNYGWALRLAGRPAEAIPYLQERLEISNYKRGVVQQELKTARQQAGQQ